MTLLRHCIYELAIPRAGEPFYIGRTNDEARRCNQHMQDFFNPGPNSSGDPRLARFRQIREAGGDIEFRVMERYASRAQAVHAENRAIERALAQGIKLVNVVGNARHSRPEPKALLVKVEGELRARLEAEAAKSNTPAKKAALQALGFGLDALEALHG